MKNYSIGERLFNGLIKENPTFVLMLGMCPTLAVTTSAINGLGMGLTTMVVLALSNLFISILRNIIPDKVRIPAFIVIIASFVTVAELLLEAYIPSLYGALGIYIPLIVVNCIILGRAEAFASKNGPILSLFDGIGMGLGFSLALTIIGAVRELLGAGECFGFRVMPDNYIPCAIFVLAPGAFFVLAVLTAIQNKVKIIGEKKGKDVSKIQSGCGTDCLNCKNKCDSPKLDTAKAEAIEDNKKATDIENTEDTKNTVDIESPVEAKADSAVTKNDVDDVEVLDLNDMVSDTVELTLSDLAKINEAVSADEKEVTE